MTDYLKYEFKDDESFINTFDELPLWSASFGLLLLKHLEISQNLLVVDIGSGAGFPLLELAERMGNTCKLYGVDPWVNANKRARQKIRNYDAKNVEIIESAASILPFENNSVDLVVSNLGINNFDNPPAVFEECERILKPGGRLALTTNLRGHWKEFYEIFYQTLSELKREDLVAVIRKDEEHRSTFESIGKLYEENGLSITKHVEDSFEMKFNDGTAFLNHHFVQVGWLTEWIKIIPASNAREVFTALEEKLNQHAARHGNLLLSVPMLFVEGKKVK